MNRVKSADGTTIAVDRTGTGPALIVVAGAFCDRHSKNSLATALSDRYTVFQYDRRGRGDSGPVGGVTVEREIEDFAAVVAQTGEKPFVFADSSGGAIVIAAAAAGVEVRKIATYEVPFTQGPSFELADQLAALVASGDRSEAVERFLQLMGIPPEAIEGMKQGPGWHQMESYAATLPIDVRLCNDGRIPQDQLAKVTVPLLAIAGDRGPWAVNVANDIAAAAPKGEPRILAGYGHDVPDAVLSGVVSTFFN
ncbi:pimeloyl-ACP methyl ester carboxylesterase [Pseudarthrobacter oxydans]|uniref:alpha/beta fold hydrolase n=1 Tax=Pseudarthrobacter oxydans TaxID=1671 RepID=UPI00277DAA2A|nr:alpha/beta hydrolase [Pseudarthrobacter oxydans]MDP9983920.1 pimeloyl-ACP methyl ester carboxylesterase [Pseudarthrobacter oxydans]